MAFETERYGMGIGSWYGVDGVTILMMDLVDGSLLLRQADDVCEWACRVCM